MVKDYGLYKNSSIISTEKFGNLLAVGGYNRKLILINMNIRKILINPVDTAIYNIFSINFCSLYDNSKLSLIVSGGSREFTNDNTDIFDITDIFKVNKNMYNSLSQENNSIIKDDNE